MKNELKVLIVDDFELPRRLIRNMLNELGYENHANILEAVDGVDALNVLQCNAVDLIICDWVMPNMSGLELLKTVRQDEKYSKIPFIMVTAEAEKEKIMDAIKSGVSQYIVKPFAADALYKKMQAVMEKGCA
ncbi:MAG: response regulator [Desulfobulbaceae bacterium]|nr:response regulator [Desulfobulbaceae bacterium]